MARLTVNTNVSSIYIVGEYNNWDTNSCLRFTKRKGKKQIVINDMPIGEYKILCKPIWVIGEELDENGHTKPNRKFSGECDEIITAIFG